MSSLRSVILSGDAADSKRVKSAPLTYTPPHLTDSSRQRCRLRAQVCYDRSQKRLHKVTYGPHSQREDGG